MDKEKHFQNLQKNFLKKKFNEVLENSKKLLKKFPKEIFLLNICGLSLYFLNKNYEAILHFNKAIEIDNNNYYIKINLANALTNTGEYEEAEKNYIEAALIFAEGFQKFPDSIKAAEMLFKLSQSLYQVEKTNEACKTMEKLIIDFPKNKIIPQTKKQIVEYNCLENNE